MEELEKVAVLGSGWLGAALIGDLCAGGYDVHGSYRREVTRQSVLNGGGKPFYLNLPGEIDELGAFLSGVGTLIITLPPGGRRLGEMAMEKYLKALRSLSDMLTDLHVIYTSSTGVYGSGVSRRINEEQEVAPDTYSSRAVVAAEEWLRNQTDSLTVLRLAGLFGPDRDPARFFGDRPTVADGDAPVNMVHREDVIAAIMLMLRLRPKGIFNVCTSTHPSKRVFYGRRLQLAGLPEKEFLPGGGDKKVIDSTRIRALGWLPKYDDLMRL